MAYAARISITEISVYKSNCAHRVQLRSSHDFFKKPFVHKLFHNRIEFRPATLESRNTLSVIVQNKSRMFGIPKNGYDIPLGRLELEEGSNEDLMIYYFEKDEER